MHNPNQPPISDPFYTPPAPGKPSALNTPGENAPGSYAPPGVAPVQREWKDAPSIVKGGAYPLAWLAIVIIPLVMIAVLAGVSDDSGRGNLPGSDPVERGVYLVIFGVLLGINIWLNRALKRGASAAWVVQIIISVLGLLSFPVGTLIHGYLLSQWFKPETKAWFGRS